MIAVGGGGWPRGNVVADDAIVAVQKRSLVGCSKCMNGGGNRSGIASWSSIGTSSSNEGLVGVSVHAVLLTCICTPRRHKLRGGAGTAASCANGQRLEDEDLLSEGHHDGCVSGRIPCMNG